DEYEEEGRQCRHTTFVQHLHVIEQMHLVVADDIASVAVAGGRRCRRWRRIAGSARAACVLGVDRPHREPVLVGISGIPELVRHQKNLSCTMIVSPGCTMSASLTRSSNLFPFTMRAILIRPVD